MTQNRAMRNPKTMTRSLLAALFIIGAGTAAFAQTPTSLGKFNNWSAWSYQGNKGKVCYVHSTPTALKPDSLNHGDVSFFIRKSSEEGVTNEANFVVGYAFQENSTVVVDIDGRKFTMFTQGDSAWILNPAEEPELHPLDPRTLRRVPKAVGVRPRAASRFPAPQFRYRRPAIAGV